MENLESDCDQCILQLDRICSKNDADKVKICKSLKNRQRVKFAHANGLLKFSVEGHFTQMFWSLHNPIDLAIPILCLGKAFEKEENIYNYPEFFVKKTILIEIITKFRKIAEDIGAILQSYDKESITLTYKYIHYSVSDVVNFFNTVDLSDRNKIFQLFNYPSYDKSCEMYLKLQNSAEAIKDCLKFTKDEYIELRELYNAYKHGFRVCISQQIPLIEKKLNLPYEDKFSILYFKSNQMRHLMGPLNSFEFKTEDMNTLFSNFFIQSIKLLILTQIFIFNYENMLYPDKFQRFKIFPIDLDDLIDSDFDILGKLKEIETIII